MKKLAKQLVDDTINNTLRGVNFFSSNNDTFKDFNIDKWLYLFYIIKEDQRVKRVELYFGTTKDKFGLEIRTWK
ncbi:MAG: hypothetical protein RBR10_12810 [Bacteroidales bacterium]|jgi:hypothetical protein|nr:hypothetical protein [Bacteroidales bacterium]MDY0370713.1 hypothetical protein [Bacteroidales bacterium]